MESVKKLDDKSNLENNKLLGNPNLINSEIQFNGFNNVLVCEGNINLKDSKIVFQGNNTVIYLSYTSHDYNLNLFVRSDSTIFIGKNNEFGFYLDINIQEHQNLIIGDDGIFGNRVTIRTCDAHSIYNINTKKRINFSDSIFIGDHVWIDHFSYISHGVYIGSGSIVGIHSFVPPSMKIHSNTHVLGNPSFVINKDVFFTNEFTGIYNEEDTINSSSAESDIYTFEFMKNETISMEKIDKILKQLNVSERVEFIEKLFIKNRTKNRFYY